MRDESRVLRATIVWNDSGKAGGSVDNGARIVDSSGIHVTREKTGKTHIEGEVIFKWIFTAVGDAPPASESSGGYIDTGETITLVFAGLVVVAIGVMMFLLFVKRKKKNDQQSQ